MKFENKINEDGQNKLTGVGSFEFSKHKAPRDAPVGLFTFFGANIRKFCLI